MRFLRGCGVLLATVLAACTVPAAAPTPPADDEARTAAYFEQIRGRPPYLDAFLRRMPKGGDLHTHFSGAIYAENYLRWAAQDGLCLDRASFKLSRAPCTAGQSPAAATLQDPALYAQTIDALSMRNFLPTAGVNSGHDHFFATFDKFTAAQDNHFAEMLAEVTDRAGEQSVSYLELMSSPGMGAAMALGRSVGWDDDLGRLREKLLGPKMTALVAEVRREIDAAEAGMRRLSKCGTATQRPGCAVTVRYQAQVIRVFSPVEVFAQMVLAFEQAKDDPRIVGINLVAPEDAPPSLKYYDVQMRMLGYLHALQPDFRIALHAGELTAALPGVTPDDLRSHIRSAVRIAGASRIGHGVDILGEDDAAGLMAEMARRRVMVEINFTSNDTILNVVGAQHPFEAYRRAGVPLALSTDDEGVSRIDLTHEFVRASRTYGLSYGDLKTLVRNSLEYAFLPGDSLWRTTTPFARTEACAGALSPACRDLLGRSQKAAAQWRLEEAFARFEASTWPLP